MGQSSPRFRKALAASATEVDGVTFVDVSDESTGTTFRLYDFEYELALQLDGQPLDDVVVWAASTYGMELTPEGIEEFAGRLGELGFLEPLDDATTGVDMIVGEDPPVSGAVMAPAQPTNSAEVEWLSLQNAKTTSFVPDALMLQNAAEDRTPVPSLPPPSQAPARGGSLSKPRSPTPSGVTELPDEAMTETADLGATRSPSVPGLPALPHAAGAAPANGTGATAPAPSRQGPPPRGIAERRMPPSPEAVVMSSFQDEVSRSRFTAPPPARASRRGPMLLILLVILAGGGAAGYYRWSQLHPSGPEARKLRVISPKPTAVYRWFSTTGTVTDAGSRPLAFEGSGRVAELAAVGKPFAAGDVVGKLQGASALEAELAKQRPRLAAAEQLRDSAKAAGNQAELRKAESKLAERKKAFDEAQAGLNKMLLRASEPGQVTETLVKVGATVPGKTSALKWKGKLLHGDFTLDEEDFGQAAALDFCRVEVVATSPATGGGGAAGTTPPAPSDSARFLDCQLPPPAPAPTARSGSLLRKFLVTLPPTAGLAPGHPLRLARLRYDAVFTLPLSAIVHTDGGDKVWVASPLGVAQLRPVTIAESRDEALVSGGLAIGEDIIIEPPADLRDGARVAPLQ
jgi:multidrug efflux pump subunit AcrA (membrane-fusion protein)